MYISEWKKSVWKGYILSDSNYMTFWKGQNNEEIKKISGCQGWGRNGSMIATGNRVSFGSDENILELDTLDGCTILWIY